MKAVSDISLRTLLGVREATSRAAFEAFRSSFSAKKWQKLAEKHPNGMKIYRLATAAGENVTFKFFDVSMTREDIYKAAIRKYGYNPEAYVDMKIYAKIYFARGEAIIYKMGDAVLWQTF